MKVAKQIVFLILFLSLLLSSVTAQAGIPYYTLTVGADGELVETQTAYEPVRSMLNFDGETVKKPSDLTLGPDGNLYIADYGNKRVLVVTTRGNLVKAIGDKKTLSKPSGVFVDDELNVYVADEGKSSVFKYDKDGNLLRQYKKPEHPMFGDTATFKPLKVSVDDRGNMYILSNGNSNGIIKMDAKGEFLGYFGANTTTVSLDTVMKKLLYTEEQFTQASRTIIPVSVQGICIDEKGMIYTVSIGQSRNQAVRRLNVAGNSNLTAEYAIDSPECIAVGPNGSIIVANAAGEIMELTSEGKLLFLTSAIMYSSTRKGLYKSISGVAVDDDYTIYVLDKVLGSIQVLVPTEFANIVHNAFSEFQNGRYSESKELWIDAKRMNSLFSYAGVGLGEALYREGDYESAMAEFRNAGDKTGYSDAFWEVRANWLHNHLGMIVWAAAVAVILLKALQIVQKRTKVFQPVLNGCAALGRIRVIEQFGYAFYALRNPSDAAYGIKRERKASVISASFMLLLFFAVYVAQKYLSGFLFKTVRDGTYELILDAEIVLLVFALVVGCFYLVCAVKEGEARFRDLYIGIAYSLTPVVILCPLAVLLSNVLTYNEAFLVSIIYIVAYGWAGVQFVLMLMFLNDFSLRKTIGVIVWSAFTILVVVAVAFIVIVLLNQLWDFIASIYGEAVYRYVK